MSETWDERMARERTDQAQLTTARRADYSAMLRDLSQLEAVTEGAAADDCGYVVDAEVSARVTGTPAVVEVSFRYPYKAWTARMFLPREYDKHRTSRTFSIQGTRTGTAGARDIARRLLTPDNLEVLARHVAEYEQTERNASVAGKWFDRWIAGARATGATVRTSPDKRTVYVNANMLDGFSIELRVENSGHVYGTVRISSPDAADRMIEALGSMQEGAV